MICKNCGKEFISIFSDVCPFCGADNSVSLFDSIFSSFDNKTTPDKKKPKYDPNDWENPDNCSDREYMDDDDYDEDEDQ